MDSTLQPFFEPAGVAVVGASHEPEKLGYGVAFNLLHSGYAGAIHFVNPRGGMLLDRPVHRNLAEVPDPVDLAVIIIPASAVPAALRKCADRGIFAAVILSGGFRETGGEGALLEARVAGLARERGIRLSGGQRQRLAIARALYHDPDVLFFDEATSALDAETENAIVESIQSLAHRKTIVIIAHRLSTLRYCDRVFVLDEGRVSRETTFEIMTTATKGNS